MLSLDNSSCSAGRALELINLFFFNDEEEFDIVSPLFVEDGVFNALKQRSTLMFGTLTDLDYASEHLQLISRYIQMT